MRSRKLCAAPPRRAFPAVGTLVRRPHGPSKDQLTHYPAMERIDFDESLAQARDTSVHPMEPFIASLVAQDTLPSFVPADFGYSNDRAWNQAQSALARLVPNTRHLVVKGLDHTIQIDHPQAVTNALHDVFNRAR